MKKITIGDVFAIKTPRGEAYLQYAYKDNSNIEIIRVLPGLFLDRPADIVELVNRKELFLVRFPLAAAYRKKIVEFVGHYPIPSNFEKPRYMRSDFIDKDGNLIWHIIDTETGKRQLVKELSEEQKMLSPYDIWNDTFLIERLTEGWTLDKWV